MKAKRTNGLSDQEKANLAIVKQLIETGYRTHYTTEYLASLALMSRSKLIKSYRSLFGMALFEHLKHYRMLHARRLVEEDKLPFKQIAGLCGYRHQGNFTSAFKKKFGLTPTQYREL